MNLEAVPPWFLSVYAATVGLITGSFLNVVIHRLPKQVSTVRPRSRCPYCGGAIIARDNIPVVSYLLLKGRCRHCKAPISPRYPAIELITGGLFVACVQVFGFSGEGLAAAVFCALMVALAAIDLENFILPDRLTLPGIAIGLALQPWIPGVSLLEAVLGVLVGAGVLILVINVWYWLKDTESMGLGDVNMLATIGAFLGWQGVIASLFLASLLGAIAGIGLMIFGKATLKAKLPFGFFLALGALVTLFFGPRLYQWYAGLL